MKTISLAARLRMDSEGSKCGSRRTDEEAVIQMRHGSGLDPGGNNGGGEKWLGSGYILKEEPVGVTDRLDVECERKKGIR